VALRAAKLKVEDFEAVLETTEEGDFAYLDPPYTSSSLRHGEYGYGSYTPRDNGRLLSAITGATNRGVSILLSYGADSEIVTSLPSAWRILEFDTPRQVGGGHRIKRTREILAINYD
jgi:site-specific DNA-adenine methylase